MSVNSFLLLTAPATWIERFPHYRWADWGSEKVTGPRTHSWEVPEPRFMVTWLLRGGPYLGRRQRNYDLKPMQDPFSGQGRPPHVVWPDHSCLSYFLSQPLEPLLSHSFHWVILFPPPSPKISTLQGDPVKIQIFWSNNYFKTEALKPPLRPFKTDSLGMRPRNMHFDIFLSRWFWCTSRWLYHVENAHTAVKLKKYPIVVVSSMTPYLTPKKRALKWAQKKVWGTMFTVGSSYSEWGSRTRRVICIAWARCTRSLVIRKSNKDLSVQTPLKARLALAAGRQHFWPW